MRTKSITADADARIGERLRAARMAAGLNQTKSGAAAALSLQRIRNCAAGRDQISVSRLQVSAKAIRITTASLLSAEDGYADDGDLKRLTTYRVRPVCCKDALPFWLSA